MDKYKIPARNIQFKKKKPRTRKNIQKETYVIQRTKRQVAKKSHFTGNSEMQLSYRSTIDQMGGAMGISLTDSAKVKVGKFKVLIKDYVNKFSKFFKTPAQKALIALLSKYDKYSICADNIIVKSMELKKAWDKINFAILNPVLGIHGGGQKHTETLITLGTANMIGNRIKIVLSRLANLRKNNTVHFAYRCTSVRGTAKKAGNALIHAGRTVSTGYKKITGKYQATNDNILKQSSSIDYTYFMCVLKDYRKAELEYNQTQAELVRQFLSIEEFKNRNIGDKTRFNKLDIFRQFFAPVTPVTVAIPGVKQVVQKQQPSTPMERLTQLQAKTDTNIKDLETLLTKIAGEKKQGNSGTNSRSSIAAKYVKRLGESDEKVMPILTYIYNNSVYLAQFIDIVRQRLYLETLIRPNDELAFSEANIGTVKDSTGGESSDTRDKSNRVDFIRTLYSINHSLDTFTKELTPSIEKFIKQEYYGSTNQAAKEEEQDEFMKKLLLDTLQQLYSRFSSATAQNQDARDFVTMIQLFISKYNEETPDAESPMYFLVGIFNMINDAITEQYPSLNLARFTKSELTNVLLELINQVKAGEFSGMDESEEQEEGMDMGGGAVYGQLLAGIRTQQGALHSSQMIPNVDYIIETVQETKLKYMMITESGLVKLYGLIMKLLQNPYFISKQGFFAGIKSAVKSVYKGSGRIEDSSSAMEVYMNYLLKLDYGVLGYDLQMNQLDKMPLDYPQGTAMSNLPGFVTAFLYKHYYKVSKDINFSDFALLDLKIYDTVNKSAPKKYVYTIPKEEETASTTSSKNNNIPIQNEESMNELAGLFNDAVIQGDNITIPPSFLPFTMYTNAELLSLLQGNVSDSGISEVRQRIEENSLSIGKMDNMQFFMDNSCEAIIGRFYTKLLEYQLQSINPNAEMSQDDLRIVFDKTLSRIMVFLKLNHLFSDLVKFKKIPSKPSTTGAEPVFSESIRELLAELTENIGLTINQLKAEDEPLTGYRQQQEQQQQPQHETFKMSSTFSYGGPSLGHKETKHEIIPEVNESNVSSPANPASVKSLINLSEPQAKSNLDPLSGASLSSQAAKANISNIRLPSGNPVTPSQKNSFANLAAMEFALAKEKKGTGNATPLNKPTNPNPEDINLM